MTHRTTLIALALSLVPVLANAQVDEALLKNKIAAYRVIAGQYSIADRAIINANMRLEQARMASIGALRQSLRQLEIFQNFSAYTGQGAQVCDSAMNREELNNINARIAKLEFVSMSNKGRLMHPPTTYTKSVVDEQLDKYCSPDQHNARMCRSRMDGLGGANTNYANLASAEQFTKRQLDAAKSFVSNMVPSAPQTNIKSANSCDRECRQSRIDGMRSDVLSSLVAVPLGEHFAYRIGAKTYAKTQDDAKRK